MKTSIKTLCAMALLTISASAFAGDGTKENPYTVSELNAQKDALAASGNAVWVKADLKGLGEDGSLTENGTTDETRNDCAGLFGDETGTFVAYSYQILANLAISDLTKTKDLLISLTYGTTGHPHGNTSYPESASNYEPADAHFSLEEVHGALSLEIKGGYRGYHIASCYTIPKDIIAIKVSAGYSSKNGAYVNCNNVYNGAEETHVTSKDAALVLLGADGVHDFVLSTGLYTQTISNGNAMTGGSQAGLNTYSNKNTYCFRFTTANGKIGFERNSDETAQVTLESKDEVYLHVSSLATNFYGKWEWETEDKKWISWTGSDYQTLDIRDIRQLDNIQLDNSVYDLRGRKLSKSPMPKVYIQNGKKYIAK